MKVFKVDLEGDSEPEPLELSEMLHDFGEALLEAEAPSDVAGLRQVWSLIAASWNLPMLAPRDGAVYSEVRRVLDAAAERASEDERSLLQQLIEDRLTRFGLIPFTVTVTVEGETLADATIRVEPRAS
jgi:hypothetical protein